MKKIISIFSCFVALLFIFPITTLALAPSAPTVDMTPVPTQTNTPYWISFSSNDPEGNQIYYQFDWDRNGTYDEFYPSTGYVPSGGAPRSLLHFWTSYGNNSFNVKATDSTGLSSTVTTYSLNMVDFFPSVPVITGPAGQLNTGVSHDFNFVSTDPNGRQISYEAEFDGSGVTIYLPPFFGYVNSGTSQTASKSYSTAGARFLRVRAKNNAGNYSAWRTYNFTIVSPNVAPANPVVTNNPSATINTPLQFNFSSSDANNDNLVYEVDFDANGTVDRTVPVTGDVAPNTTQTTTYTWNTTGNKTVNFRARDTSGAFSGWTSRTIQIFSVNTPPNNPVVTIPTGPFYPNRQYTFQVSSSDANGDDVMFWIDWNNDGLGDSSVFFGTQGTTRTFTNPANTWTTSGNKSFKVLAVDTMGTNSAWVDVPLTLVTPPPPTVSLSFNPPYLTPGVSTSIVINWSSSDASSCSAVGTTWPGHNTLSGSYSPPALVSSPQVYTWACSGSGGSATTTAYLGYPVDLWGWGWSSNIGWISFSSANAGAGGGSSYSVKMGTTTTKGYLTGYGWSPNIGWISFGSGDGAHPNGVVDFTTGAVTGWARACAATVNGRCFGATRPDWDGWISLSGSNHGSPGTGVSYDASTGKFRGFSWGSDVIGWLTVDSLISPPLQGPLVISTTTQSCDLTVNPNTLPASGGTVNLAWTSSGVVGNSCNLTGPNGYSRTGLSGNANLNTVIGSGDNGGRYDLRCNTDRIICSANLTKGGGSGPPIINPFPKMWLDNDPGQAKVVTTIRQGQIAKVNWKFGARYTGCVGNNVSQTNGSLPAASTWFGAGTEISTNYYLSNISGLTEGVYELNLACDNNNFSNTVKIVVKGTNSTVIEEI